MTDAGTRGQSHRAGCAGRECAAVSVYVLSNPGCSFMGRGMGGKDWGGVRGGEGIVYAVGSHC